VLDQVRCLAGCPVSIPYEFGLDNDSAIRYEGNRSAAPEDPPRAACLEEKEREAGATL